MVIPITLIGTSSILKFRKQMKYKKGLKLFLQLASSILTKQKNPFLNSSGGNL